MKFLNDFLDESTPPPEEPDHVERRDWGMNWGTIGEVISFVPWWQYFLLPYTGLIVGGFIVVATSINLVVKFLALTLDGVEYLSNKTWYAIAYYIWKHSKEGKEWKAEQKAAQEKRYAGYQADIDHARVEQIARQLKVQADAAIKARKRSGKKRMTQKEALKGMGKKVS